jgi:hypothetical protein
MNSDLNLRCRRLKTHGDLMMEMNINHVMHIYSHIPTLRRFYISARMAYMWDAFCSIL